jgi:hypothetical protein
MARGKQAVAIVMIGQQDDRLKPNFLPAIGVMFGIETTAILIPGGGDKMGNATDQFLPQPREEPVHFPGGTNHGAGIGRVEGHKLA